jgi:hypothetical protein
MRRLIRSDLPQILLIGFGQLCLLFVGSRAEAEDIGQWFAGFSQPVHITAIAVDPLNETRIFAGGAGEKSLYRTTDGGRTWAAVGTGLPSLGALSCFAFDAGSPDRIYVGSFVSGVFRSTDGGQTWTASIRASDMQGDCRRSSLWPQTPSSQASSMRDCAVG